MAIVPGSSWLTPGDPSDAGAAVPPPDRPRDVAPARPSAVRRPEALPAEMPLEVSLRPQRLADYFGQRQLKESLAIAIEAAKRRGEPLDHLLLYGPPGLGKTTLAGIVANEMESKLHITSAPALERPRDLAGLLVALQPGDVLFIDEIHRLNRLAEEILYPAMEDFSLDITIGKGQTARIKRVPLPRFTLVGATTRIGALSAPLRDRFGFLHRLGFYDEAELAAIVERAAKLLGISLASGTAAVLAGRSRGTPRIANRLLKRTRDYAQVRQEGPALPIGTAVAEEALAQLEIDARGLDPTDRQLLTTIIQAYNGGPVGLETLAAAVGEDEATLADVYEPFLLQQGFLLRTPRGRVATPRAYHHLGLNTAFGANHDAPFLDKRLLSWHDEAGG